MPNNLAQRIVRLGEILKMIEPIPEEWIKGAKEELAKKEGSSEPIQCLPCKSYKELINWWKKAMRWRQEMDDVFTVLLAVAMSTEQVGDQLFLQFIGQASGGKTKFCDAMLVSPHGFALENVTGFTSGYNDGSGEDFSLLARANRKFWITPEGDTMMKSPRFAEIMSQQRRIFDGTSSATYKTRKEDIKYTGLRTPWVIAGTPAMLSHDQSQLGDRFLRLFYEPPDEDEKREILKRVAYTAIRSVKRTSNGIPESQLEENLCKAYQYTGGYINYLIENAESILCQLEINEEELVDYCADLGEFTAKLRARPNQKQSDIETGDEMPTRLTHQFVRLAMCLTAVMNHKHATPEVMRRVTKVAIDTSRGHSLQIVKYLFDSKVPMGAEAIGNNTQREEWSIRKMLYFLCKIGVVEWVAEEHQRAVGIKRWKLTPKMRRLYQEVVGNA